MQMRTVVVDKIASIAQACGLSHEIRIATTDIPCEEGVVLVVEILNNKSTYNTLELTSGRMAKVARGDVIVGALVAGSREAYTYLPQSVDRFVTPDELARLMEAVGLRDVRVRRVGLGTVTIHVGRVGRGELAGRAFRAGAAA